MPRGGKRPGAGRPRGRQDKATAQHKLLVERGMQAILEDGILPLDVMMRRMRGDDTITDAQFAAACAAAPYVHPKLTAVEMNAVIKRNAADMSDEDLAAIAGASRAGSSGEPAKGPDQLH